MTVKKIGFIARALNKGGVARVLNNLLENFDQINNPNYQFVLFTDRQEYIKKFKNIKIVYLAKTFKPYWDYIKIIPALRKEQPEVVIYPQNIIPFTHQIFSPAKKINLVHDLAYFESQINEYPLIDTLYQKLFLGYSCRIADRTIAISKSTKNDLIKYVKANPQKIDVIYEGLERKFTQTTDWQKINSVLDQYQIKKPYIFYCGSLSPRKNILRTLQAFYQIKNSVPHQIYLSGSLSWHDQEIKDYIAKNLADRVCRIGYIEDDDLPMVFSAADLFLYPTLYEGFGLSVLEAQACGCPVLACRATSIPEVAGESLNLLDPYSVEKMKEEMLRILTEPQYKNSLIEKGFQNIKRFSWKKMAEEIIELIQKNLI